MSHVSIQVIVHKHVQRYIPLQVHNYVVVQAICEDEHCKSGIWAGTHRQSVMMSRLNWDVTFENLNIILICNEA